MMNTGKTFVKSKNKMLSTIAWRIDGEVTYALEGSVFVAGALIQWLRDKLGIIKNAAEVENLAKSVDNNGGVTFIPALSGLAAPYWDPYAQGTIFGIKVIPPLLSTDFARFSTSEAFFIIPNLSLSH